VRRWILAPDAFVATVAAHSRVQQAADISTGKPKNERRNSRTHADQWKSLWSGYNEFYKRVGPTAIPTQITQLTWERFFDAYEPLHALVADDGGRLVGLVHYIVHRNTTMRGPVFYLQDLFTDPAARGKGVGKTLIHAVYEKARTAGSTRVYWHTHESNATAMRLYDAVADRSGFLVYRKDL
jgi:GNAT superfamily N-acetyltransferase